MQYRCPENEEEQNQNRINSLPNKKKEKEKNLPTVLAKRQGDSLISECCLFSSISISNKTGSLSRMASAMKVAQHASRPKNTARQQTRLLNQQKSDDLSNTQPFKTVLSSQRQWLTA